MAARELVILGTASLVPTRTRNHNGYFLRWDREGILFDPGEGTQRQLVHAGLAASAITRLCLTHFHGDHCLGVPGVVQRFSLDRASHPLQTYFPASGQEFFDRLRHASVFHDSSDIREHPITGTGVIATGDFGTLTAQALNHPIDVYGYRLVEPDGRRMLPELLAEHAITGADISHLVRDGSLRRGDRTVTVADVSEPRRGQRFAFIMDTRLCDGVYALAEGVDLLVIEATFLHADVDLAHKYGHLTAAQAGQVAAAAGVRHLVLTHFSQRYTDLRPLHAEAAQHFSGQITVAEDLMRIPVPPRR